MYNVYCQKCLYLLAYILPYIYLPEYSINQLFYDNMEIHHFSNIQMMIKTLIFKVLIKYQLLIIPTIPSSFDLSEEPQKKFLFR